MHKVRRKADQTLLVLKQINIKNMSSRARNDAQNEVQFIILGHHPQQVGEPLCHPLRVFLHREQLAQHHHGVL